MNTQKVYSRLAEIIVAAQHVVHEAGDAEFEMKLRCLEIMTLDRLYVAMDEIESGGRQAADQKQRRMKTRRLAGKPLFAMKAETGRRSVR